MAVSLKMERETKTLDEILQEAERLHLREKAAHVLKGRTPTEYVRDMRDEISRKYPGDKLFEFYREP